MDNILKPVAACGLSYFHSLNIYDFVYGIDDAVIAGINKDKPRKYKLYYSGQGAYFNYKGSRFYINEFLRC